MNSSIASEESEFAPSALTHLEECSEVSVYAPGSIQPNGVLAMIAQWQTWQPHLILMDVQMPEMNGYEATRQIRLQEAAEPRSPTPIIALTAYAFEADCQASLQSGCNKHIAKPFNETVLFETVTRYLGAHYCYSDKLQDSLPRKTITPQDLQSMPVIWLAQVHEAALDLQDERLYQLMAQIPGNDQWLIQAMTSLVERLQFEAIATLTQSQEES